jgi:hypothetical protein
MERTSDNENSPGPGSQDERDDIKSQEERDDLQSPLVHEGAPSEHHDGNEDADDLVEVVEPDGQTTPRVANEGGRSAEPDDSTRGA